MPKFPFKVMLYYDNQMVLEWAEAETLDEAFDVIYDTDRPDGTHIEVAAPVSRDRAVEWDDTIYHDWEL